MTINIGYEDEAAIRALLLGRTVTKVADDKLLLDNGTQLTIHSNEGCGGCGNGWYEVTELNDSPNAIMAVDFEEADEEDDVDFFRIFVLAEDQRIKLLQVKGYDNGYYGVGYWIEVS